MTATVEFIPREKIEEKARKVLEKNGIIGPNIQSTAVNPVAVATNEGIEVFALDLADDSICGILRKENGKFRIYVNQDHSGTRIRYTIAHELGHYFLHSELFEDFVDQEINLYRNKSECAPEDKPRADMMETQANMFAAALLMPAESVRRWYTTERDISKLAKMFGVSREAMGYRIGNLGL